MLMRMFTGDAVSNNHFMVLRAGYAIKSIRMSRMGSQSLGHIARNSAFTRLARQPGATTVAITHAPLLHWREEAISP